MGDIVERRKALSAALWADTELYWAFENGRPIDADVLDRILDAASDPEAATTISTLKAEVERLRGALAPFSAMGRVMEKRATITFGRMPPDGEIVCESSGEAGMGILTMGHFRDAAALLPNAPGWGGMYVPPFIRQTLEADHGQ